MKMTQIDRIVRNALTDFTNEVFARSWWGKEREAVSLFAFGYLIKQCAPGTVFFDPAQVGVEVRVLKPEGLGIKREICKDLVIWSRTGATCWDDSALPMAVLEWKAGRQRVCETDIAWLRAFSANRPKFTGYVVCLDLLQRRFRLSCVRVRSGEAHPWLVL